MRRALALALAMLVATCAPAAALDDGVPLRLGVRSAPSNGVVWFPSPCTVPADGILELTIFHDPTYPHGTRSFGPIAAGELVPLYLNGSPPQPSQVRAECTDGAGDITARTELVPLEVTAARTPPPLLTRTAPALRSRRDSPSRADVLARPFVPSLGSMHGLRLRREVVAIAARSNPSSAQPDGYWLAAADGGVFTYGVAPFLGGAAHLPLRAPVVDVAARADGAGYWLAAADGGVFAFGTAAFRGSAADLPLREPVVAIVPTATGEGYWLIARDGGVFAFGDAAFAGTPAPTRSPVVAAAAAGTAYVLVAADGTVFDHSGSGIPSATGRIGRDDPVAGIRCSPYYGSPVSTCELITASGITVGVSSFGVFAGLAHGRSLRLLDVAPSAPWLLVQR